MAYVITQSCCNDASCVEECPVDCIRPAPAEREFAATEMLHIDPDTCIDCGACVDACPVNAIYPDDELPADQARYTEINAAWFQRHPLVPDMSVPDRRRPPKELGTLRVAIVGAGPAACYAAMELLSSADVEVDMFDRLPTPYGLVRAGVAPDHPDTKGVGDLFESAFGRDNFQYYLNVEAGKHISHDELLAHHHAVIYAHGASTDRHLDIPGEDLPGCVAATELVAWYNGHPDYAQRTFDFSSKRAVIVGNGNVALDVARILLLGAKALSRTDAADYAIAALGKRNIEEVVILGRRGPAQAAYTTPEFLALGQLPGFEIVIDPGELELDPVSRAVLDQPGVEPGQTLKVALAQEYVQRGGRPNGKPGPRRKLLVFRYCVSPTEILGSTKVTGIRLVHNDLREIGGELRAVPNGRIEELETGLVVRAVGYRGTPLGSLPFDERRDTIRNESGRVCQDDGTPVPGVYVSGWIKRGPRGVIGTNKADSHETVRALLADFMAGKLAAPQSGRAELRALLGSRQPDLVDKQGWRKIDAAERAAGKRARRPRVKLVTVEELVRTARRR